MCLSIPAKLLDVSGDGGGSADGGADSCGGGAAALTRTGKVSIGGIRKEISLAYVPEARPGDYVLIHVGFAISIIDEEEAQFVFDYLKQTDAEFEVLP